MQCITNVPYANIAGQHKVIKEELLSAVSNVIDHGKFVLGPEVEEFEKRFAQTCGSSFAVSVHSGTDALILALRVLGVGPGDEVITPPNGFISTASSITYVGARPVFVDVGEDYNIDPKLIENAITSKTKAIIPVHLTGRPANMESILSIAQKHKLLVIEDAAQSVNASFSGKKVGSIGDIGCFSLHPLKTLNACGDGGVLTTNDRKIYKQLQILRNNGFKNREECEVFSNNSRLDTLQAAMLLVKLNYLQEWTERRQENAKIYQEKLNGIEQIKKPVTESRETAVYHTFVIQAQERDALQAFLLEHGIKTKIHYPIPMHLQEAAKDLSYKEGDFPIAEKQAKDILSLPIYAGLEEEQINYVVECIKDFYEGESS